MKHAFHWKRAAFLAAALAFAGQARALGGQSGASGNGTGGPQVVHHDGAAAEASAASPTRSAGIPAWYAVGGAPRAQPTQGPLVVEPSQAVPGWYAVS
jgi:hypothetical protein